VNGAAAMKATKDDRATRRRALGGLGVPNFRAYVEDRVAASLPPGEVDVLQRRSPKVLQLNVGLYCNQACGHCHVESSPLRTEAMTAETAAQCLRLLERAPGVTTLDITGGAPELHEVFRYLVRAARAMRPSPDDLDIIDRCNLTVLQEPGQADLVDFLKEHRVRVVASLPCYTKDNVDKQRGRGIFERSIAALLALNEAGYGQPGTGLNLDLVYNPGGAFLPGDQSQLEADYKRELRENFGVSFNSLFTITNMPIKRFADYLHRRGELREYMDLLVANFNAGTTEHLMCRDTVSVAHDGRVYDCDFNQQLGYELMVRRDGEGGGGGGQGGLTVHDLRDLDELRSVPIRTDRHCFGCTAGAGSSCQGTLAP
jgi:radical SAM/Cys-rich protein